MRTLNDIASFRVLQQVVFDGKEHSHRRLLFDLPREYRRLEKAIEPVGRFPQSSPLCKYLLYDLVLYYPVIEYDTVAPNASGLG